MEVDFDKKIVDDLNWHTSDLFDQVDKRIETKKAEMENQEVDRIEMFKKTSEVAKEVIKYVYNTITKAEHHGEIINDIDEKLGIISYLYYGNRCSKYDISDDGLEINLNFTTSSLWQEQPRRRPKNFVDDVDWDFLVSILGAYGIEITRKKSEVNDCGHIEFDDYVTIKVPKKFKSLGFMPPKDATAIYLDEYYRALCLNREALFNEAERRIKTREERDLNESKAREGFEKINRIKTDMAISAILDLFKDTFATADEEEAVISSVDERLGVLGTDLYGSERSHYSIDDKGMTICLNYSRTKDSESYSRCFADEVDWTRLKQALLEAHIRIERETREKPVTREHPYQHYDVITLRVNRDKVKVREPNFGNKK